MWSTTVPKADVIALYGHNMAETQSVLWTRILDRLAALFAGRPFNHEPGQRWQWPISGFHLAGVLLEGYTGLAVAGIGIAMLRILSRYNPRSAHA